ncbi:30S ribosomal protein S12 methylthiotransferase RimO [Desulfurivibrio alkaliphilus]|uniref:Ribosomal protein uS12 methylthiotransferase RimO n=1 Tax=Desulfurivibrio alkaliphilus (strain DSM 19089 / UNIQEM U267 / AHT2) TaxID=589865 RepID=D6Z0U7_DESAT|nr:30S ribosomal protein S12 methylthiotransferase RimO [Desulfurivibrio alkaliphilus]ADH87207.1 MiaB-like tRNA modifying enzyme YliG [Desulfurivibrio alkaliphilus AHT 2]
MKTIHLTSLGCPKNLVDSELMLGQLVEEGLRPVSEPGEADVLLVNTCGFIQSAVEEGIDTILGLIEQKKSPAVRVVVCGCLVQRYGSGLVEELPEVDLFLGTEEVSSIAARLRALEEGRAAPESGSVPAGAPAADSLRYRPVDDLQRFLPNATLPRRLTTPAHRAYLKITEGCGNRCSYCMIPAIRGPLRSRRPADILHEARALAAAGVKELTLVAQDLTAYGLDLGPGGPRLPDLLAQLHRELPAAQVPWIRLLYLYPSRVNDELLELVAANPRILPYFDLPFQHVADPVLKAMNRPYGEALVRELVDRVRRLVPRAVIRSTFMVGFPGEREEDVEALAAFLRDCRLEHVGMFTYCNEEGSAAATLPGQVPEELKEQRFQRLMALQAEISLAANQARVGQVEEVLVEGVSSETELLLEGRAWFQAPEIDGCVYINEGNCRAGELVRVLISEAHPYDLVGGIV